MKRLAVFIATVLIIAAVIAQHLVRFNDRWRGVAYRLLGRHADPTVDDRTLADRVRSELGPVEKRLDVPRVHVQVQGHVVLLHGDVEWPHEAATIVRAARHVPGVVDVQSHLHCGLLRSDTRPSGGRHHRQRYGPRARAAVADASSD